jgi:formate-dependent nitrite reductase membrane component NrfD
MRRDFGWLWLLLLLVLGLLLQITNLRRPETFGSAWMGPQYGVSLWNGWNYGSMPLRRSGAAPEE